MGEILRRLGPADLDAAGTALREAIVGGPRASGPFPIVEADGSLNGPFGVMLHAPGVGAALSALGEAIRYGSSLDGRVREIAILAVGATRRSAYEIWAHERVAAAMGFSAAEVAALVDATWSPEAGHSSSGAEDGSPQHEREAAVYEAAVVLAAGGELSDASARRLVAALGESGAVELVTLVGYYCTLAMLLQSFQIPTPHPTDLGANRSGFRDDMDRDPEGEGAAPGHAPIPEGVDPASAELLRRAYSLDNVDDGQQLYREWAETYDRTMIEGLGYVSPRLVAESLVDLRDGSGGSVLDIGCGTGLLGSELFARGVDLIDGVDLSPSMLEVAGRRGAYRSLFEADLTDVLPFADATYGAAVCAGTFTSGHVDASCLDEIVRVLAPGAVLVCTVHHAVWHALGFAEGFARLERSGRLREIERREVGFYENTTADGFLLTFTRT